MNERVLILEGRIVGACPCCWTREEIAREHPELSGKPISDRICEKHFQNKLAYAMLLAEAVSVVRL